MSSAKTVRDRPFFEVENEERAEEQEKMDDRLHQLRQAMNWTRETINAFPVEGGIGFLPLKKENVPLKLLNEPFHMLPCRVIRGVAKDPTKKGLTNLPALSKDDPSKRAAGVRPEIEGYAISYSINTPEFRARATRDLFPTSIARDTHERALQGLPPRTDEELATTGALWQMYSKMNVVYIVSVDAWNLWLELAVHDVAAVEEILDNIMKNNSVSNEEIERERQNTCLKPPVRRSAGAGEGDDGSGSASNMKKRNVKRKVKKEEKKLKESQRTEFQKQIVACYKPPSKEAYRQAQANIEKSEYPELLSDFYRMRMKTSTDSITAPHKQCRDLRLWFKCRRWQVRNPGFARSLAEMCKTDAMRSEKKSIQGRIPDNEFGYRCTAICRMLPGMGVPPPIEGNSNQTCAYFIPELEMDPLTIRVKKEESKPNE